jgi:hypothetical protein
MKSVLTNSYGGPMMNPMNIQGTNYEVVAVGEWSVTLRGPRGGEARLVRNLKNPSAWAFMRGTATIWFRQSELDLPSKFTVAPVAADDQAAASAEVTRLERDLAKAQAASLRWADRRAALPAGSTRARVTSANAKWARAAEHRDRISDLLDAARARLAS